MKKTNERMNGRTIPFISNRLFYALVKKLLYLLLFRLLLLLLSIKLTNKRTNNKNIMIKNIMRFIECAVCGSGINYDDDDDDD